MNDVLNIERLNIRLKGIAPELAREAVSGLGRELMDRMARQAPDLSGGQPEQVDAGRVAVGRTRDAAQLRDRMATAILDALNTGGSNNNQDGGKGCPSC